MKDELRALLERRKAITTARDRLIPFAKYLSPDPDAPDDMTRSLYHDAKHHRVLAAALEEVEAGRITRLIVNMPPRHGKTRLATNLFVPWYAGRHPERSVITATYSEKFAWDHGRAARTVLENPLYQQVFPALAIKANANSVDRVETTENGIMFFLGRGTGITGRGGDLILIDDPIKDRREADSPAIRDQLWAWYTQVLQTRLMTKHGAIVIIQTRWHEDDLIGRLVDPRNPSYSESEARKWRIIDMPALAHENDVLGRAKDEPLWPERFDREYLENIRTTDVRGFQALYQGKPSPEDGSFFKSDWVRTYKRASDRPAHSLLRFYIASDHAVSTVQGRDKTCIIPVGVDADDRIWVMDDVFWAQADTAVVVEVMCRMMERYKPLFWFAEKGHITKSIGPFLRKRMLEKRVFCSIDEIQPVADKQTRAQSMQGRMAMGRVMFPSYPRWWGDAHDQMMKFPQGAHDDFVDALSMMGLGMMKLRMSRPAPKPDEAIKPFTLGWVKESSKRAEREQDYARTNGGW